MQKSYGGKITKIIVSNWNFFRVAAANEMAVLNGMLCGEKQSFEKRNYVLARMRLHYLASIKQRFWLQNVQEKEERQKSVPDYWKQLYEK
jgi:hypothetical protein